MTHILRTLNCKKKKVEKSELYEKNNNVEEHDYDLKNSDVDTITSST